MSGNHDRSKPIGYTFIFALSFAMALGVAAPSFAQFHDHHSIYVDPSVKKTLGDKEYEAVLAFFTQAETAIEKGDVDGLMTLYSDQYRNADHDKKAARAIWERIFQTFDKLASKHNMRIQSYTGGTVVVRCSGLLMGIPKGDKYLITVDNWVEQDHILTKEGASWKLLGTSGGERKRLWFDKPMHPLF